MAHLQLRDSSPDDLFPMKYDMLITTVISLKYILWQNETGF